VVSEFALVWIANTYMGVFNRLRLEIKAENLSLAEPTKTTGDDNPKGKHHVAVFGCATIHPMQKQLRAAGGVIAAYVALLIAGCKTRPLVIMLPSGYSGDVEINCGSTSKDVSSINVGNTGHIHDAICPLHKMKLNVVRNGRSVNPTGDVIWEVTGDGIPVAIRFAMR
jgi:hypothetical protein